MGLRFAFISLTASEMYKNVMASLTSALVHVYYEATTEVTLVKSFIEFVTHKIFNFFHQGPLL